MSFIFTWLLLSLQGMKKGDGMNGVMGFLWLKKILVGSFFIPLSLSKGLGRVLGEALNIALSSSFRNFSNCPRY